MQILVWQFLSIFFFVIVSFGACWNRTRFITSTGEIGCLKDLGIVRNSKLAVLIELAGEASFSSPAGAYSI